MKKILAFILCVMLIMGITSVVAFAEGNPADATEQNTAEVGNSPTENENATEGEILPSTDSVDKPITESIVDYVKSHLEEISVMVTLIAAMFSGVILRGKITGSIGTVNNNAIAIVEKSMAVINDALGKMENMSEGFAKYKEKFEDLLGEVRKNAEDKQKLEDSLKTVEAFLKTAKLATLELSNEVAELLVLANIPNSKKDELYARHSKAVHEIEAVEEVIGNDGKEA